MPKPASEPISTAVPISHDLAGTGSKEPLVCAVCLTRDRPEMLQRAIACFQAQTYQRARLCVYDTRHRYQSSDDIKVGIFHFPENVHRSIGMLRNRIAASIIGAPNPPDVFIHFDDDDWSHPARIAEQVALLQSSGKEAVGYREMLFWNTDYDLPGSIHTPLPGPFEAKYQEKRRELQRNFVAKGGGEAWLFSSRHPKYCLGTSLCYWRTVWEKRPFEDVQVGEDYRWIQGVDSLGVTAEVIPPILPYGNDIDYGQRYPRMIASIHGGNTSPLYKREYLEGSEAQRGEWQRVPGWDDYCRQTMEGECSTSSKGL